MPKRYLRNFLLYYREFNVISFSIFLLPLFNFISKVFTLKKTIKLNDHNEKLKVIRLRADNLVTHFRSNLFFVKEKEVRFFIDKNLSKDNVFFDIGANIGIFSIYAAVRKNAHVYAFEPEYSNLSLLKENILVNNLINKIYPFSLAIGKDNNITNLHIADTTPGAAVSSISSEKLNKTHESYDVIWKEGVMEMKLDEICAQLNIIPSMIKIDTDGNEKNVILGAENTLKNKKLKYIIMEKPSNKESLDFCYNYLNNLNFLEVDKSTHRNSFWKKNF